MLGLRSTAPSPEEARRTATYPLPHPHGWYHLCPSRDVAPGTVRAVQALGEPWAVFRSTHGRIGLVHGTCPHLGANLADGTVVGDCLTCPFHQWAFGCDGTLRSVPGVQRIPRARADSPPVREYNGLVLMWHGPVDAENQPPYEPDICPDVAESFVWHGEWGPPDLAMHPMEFCENAVDDAHFDLLHRQMKVPWTRLRVPGVTLDHTAHWQADPDRPHLSTFRDEAVVEWRGRPLPSTRTVGLGTFLGPASVVMIRVSMEGVGDVMIGHTHTPVNAPGQPLSTRIRFNWWAAPDVPRLLAWYVAGSWVSQWRNDIDIWTRKAHVRRPVLSRADGAIHAMRRWYAQFYDEDTAVAWLGRRAIQRSA